MNTDLQHSKTKFSFFSREPRFSGWIIGISLVILLGVLLLMSSESENIFSSFFCHHSIDRLKEVNLLRFKEFIEHITTELTLIPK